MVPFLDDSPCKKTILFDSFVKLPEVNVTLFSDLTYLWLSVAGVLTRLVATDHL
jgi:hypothetical protein